MQSLMLKPFCHAFRQVEFDKPPLSFPSQSPTQTPPSVSTHFIPLYSKNQIFKALSVRVVRDKKDYSVLHRNDGEVAYELTSYPNSEGEQAIPEVSGNDELRWQFIRRVYGILGAQISFCAAVSTITFLCPPVKEFLISRIHSGPALSVALLPFILIWPLAVYRKQYPVNIILLGLITACTSIDIALCCAAMKVQIVLQALLLTMAGVSSLTGYTFWASKKGKSFNYLGPFLSSSLAILVVTGILQLFFPLVSRVNALYAGAVAMVFSGYLVYDTESMIKHHKYNEYIVASVNIYLDIMMFFISNLDLLQYCSDLFT
uniref:BI1-like protein n=1 Tax=Kalanchoe fedtschenkoi TaxID=63787 RepID=A0A7N0ZSA7_KALFE